MCSVWWADLGRMPDFHPAPDTHSAALLLPLLNRTGRENKMKKLIDQDKNTACVLQGDRNGGCSQSTTVLSLMLSAHPEIRKCSDWTKGIINSFSLNNVSIMTLAQICFFSFPASRYLYYITCEFSGSLWVDNNDCHFSIIVFVRFGHVYVGFIESPY